MPNDAPPLRDLPRILLAILFILLLLGASLWILRPFLPALIWAALIVVATWPIMLRVQKLLWGKRALAVAVMTFAMLLVVALPLAMAAFIVADHSDELTERVKAFVGAGLPGLPAWVEKLPVVGRKAATEWQALAALSPDELYARLSPYASAVGSWLLAKAGGLAAFLLHLALTMLLSALLYASGESATLGVRAFARRLAGARGDHSVTLAGQSIRSVALGVLVTAAVQSVLGGIGLALAGVPFALVLTLVMFVLGVAQIGATPVLLLAMGWLFWSGNTLAGAVFVPWAIFVGIIDNFLKPILIKRGADLPLVLIFAGVIGGLVAFGVVGLFVGPVVLAIVYTELVYWVEHGPVEQEAPPPAP